MKDGDGVLRNISFTPRLSRVQLKLFQIVKIMLLLLCIRGVGGGVVFLIQHQGRMHEHYQLMRVGETAVIFWIRSRISVSEYVRRSFSPSNRSSTTEKWAKMEQMSMRTWD